MAKGIYPSMTVQEIIASLAQWGLSVSEEQLQRPNADFVEGIYCACLHQVTTITADTLAAPVQEAVEACTAQSGSQETDMYSAALTRNLLVYHLSRFARAAQVEDFTALDVFSPRRDRTLILLSAFINFIKFTEQLCASYIKDLVSRSESLYTERDQVSVKLREVEEKIAQLQAKRAEDEPRCEQLRQQNNALFLELNETKTVQKEKIEVVENLKADRKVIMQKIEVITKEIDTVSDGIRRLQGRIVQSPERVKRTITTMSSTVVEDRKTLAQNDAKARDLTSKIAALHKIEEDVRTCIDQLRVVESEIRQLDESHRELADLKDHFEGKTIERNELQLKQERVQKQLSNAYQKLEQAQKRAEEKKAASQRTLDRLQAEYDQMAVERRDNDQEMQKIRAQADDVEANMAEHLKTSEAELNNLLAEYWKLRHQTDVYMELLANKLNMQVR